MYHLSSYVLGGIVTALVLTPFVSGPDRSFVGTLLATSAPEATVSVNRNLKGDRRATASLIAEHAAASQTVISKTAPVSIVAPRKAADAPEALRHSTNESPAAKGPLLDGCESAFSAITDRQLADIPGRCMAALPEMPIQVATLN